MSIISLSVVLACALVLVDTYYNIRIMFEYHRMAQRTSSSLAVSKEAKEGFKGFFSLCGWGTHGMHIFHFLAEMVVIALTIQDYAPVISLVLIGSIIIHQKQFEHVSAVAQYFFEGDLKAIEQMLSA